MSYYKVKKALSDDIKINKIIIGNKSHPTKAIIPAKNIHAIKISPAKMVNVLINIGLRTSKPV